MNGQSGKQERDEQNHKAWKQYEKLTAKAKIKGLPEPVACRMNDTNGHANKTIGAVTFIPYDTTPSRVKSYVVVKNNYYMGIADRGWTNGYQFGGQLDQSLTQIAAQLQRHIAGFPIEDAPTIADLIDDSDCE